jgi:hypothetical protein
LFTLIDRYNSTVLVVGHAWGNTSAKNATSLMMMSQRTSITAMDAAYAELVVWISSFTATNAGVATVMS